MEAHNTAVAAIAERVKHFHTIQKPFRLYHGSTNSTRRSTRTADNIVDTSSLDHVLSVDVATKLAVVEPNVSMARLLEATLPHGLMPFVVMELERITVGGGFSGTSGESSSFRYGAFDSKVSSIEIVTPDGVVRTASKKHNPDLFWGAASAFGTLGVVTLLHVDLRDAAKYVRLTYELAPTAAQARRRMAEESRDEANDYIDGIVQSRDSTIMCFGRLTDDLPKDVVPRQFLRRGDPWFYLRAEQVGKQLKKQPAQAVVVDYIPITDYLFRYERGGFWAARYAFTYFMTPFNRLTRYLLDPFMRTGRMYAALHKSGLGDFYMIQDVGVPLDRHEEFQDWLDQNLGIYPLWLCPLRIRRSEPDSAHGLHSEFGRPDAPDLINFGVWGPVASTRTRSRRAFAEQNRALESKVQQLGGKKWLYAHAYYTEEEFWAHYDRGSYDALRVKYAAGHLLTVYDKVKVDVEAEEEAAAAAATGSWPARMRAWAKNVWPLRGLYGVYMTLGGGDYLLQKGRTRKSVEAKKMD
jgi:FAD/FMN-containing dehydrogenase